MNSFLFFSLFFTAFAAAVSPLTQELSSFVPNAQQFPDKWRSCDGSGNNLQNPDYGQAHTDKIRVAPTLENKGLLMGGLALTSRDKLCKCATNPNSSGCTAIYNAICQGFNAQNTQVPVCASATAANIAQGFIRWCAHPEDLCTAYGLPNPRTVSNAIFNQPDITTTPDLTTNPPTLPDVPASQYGTTAWMWAWGQFMDHVLAAETDLATSLVGEFCKKAGRSAARAAHPSLSPAEKKKSCFQPIHVPSPDPSFPNTSEMEFDRSPFTVKNGKREYLNIITTWLDASTVYGSSKADSEALRDLTPQGRGRLRTYMNTNFAPLIEETDFTIAPDFFLERREFLFGDTRGNENRILTTVHTLWVREHNRVADLLWTEWGQTKWPICTQECNDQIFELSRAWVVGLVQKIAMYDWLPELLGPNFVNKVVGCYKRTGASGPCDTYDPNVDPELTMEFSVAAFRTGHTLLTELLLRLDKDYKEVEAPLKLEDAFFLEPLEYVNKPLEITNLARGLGGQLSNRIDSQVIGSVRNMLFQFPSGTAQQQDGLDLVSLNLQRSRGNGLARANRVRQHMNTPSQAFIIETYLKPFESFAEMTSDPQLQQALATLYKDPDNVELFVAGLVEDHDVDNGARIGKTFGLLIADQFLRIRNGDRFWFENYLSPQLVQMIMNTKLADVLERNLDGVNSGEITAQHPNGNVFRNTPDLRNLPSFNQGGYLSPQQMAADEELETLESDMVQNEAQEMQSVQTDSLVQETYSPVLIGGGLLGLGLVGVGLYLRRSKDDSNYELLE